MSKGFLQDVFSESFLHDLGKYGRFCFNGSIFESHPEFKANVRVARFNSGLASFKQESQAMLAQIRTECAPH